MARADYSIFLDDTLFTEDAFSELKPGGRVLLNTRQPMHDPRVIPLDGSGLAKTYLKLPIANTVMLGAFAAVFGGISVEQLEEAVRQSMPEKLHQKNIAVIRAAVASIRKED